jgi:hypothetical protein
MKIGFSKIPLLPYKVLLIQKTKSLPTFEFEVLDVHKRIGLDYVLTKKVRDSFSEFLLNFTSILESLLAFLAQAS